MNLPRPPASTDAVQDAIVYERETCPERCWSCAHGRVTLRIPGWLCLSHVCVDCPSGPYTYHPVGTPCPPI